MFYGDLTTASRINWLRVLHADGKTGALPTKGERFYVVTKDDGCCQLAGVFSTDVVTRTRKPRGPGKRRHVFNVGTKQYTFEERRR